MNTNSASTQKAAFRTVFLGTPEIARDCLEALFASSHFQIVGVVSQPDRPAGRKMQLQASPVKKLALEKGTEVITPEKMDEAAIEKVKSWRPDVAIVVAFGQILPQSFLDILPARIVNLHTSLLPKWRGAAPVQRAIMAGDAETGVCLQVMVRKLDAGDIIASAPVRIEDHISAVELLNILGKVGSELIANELPAYLTAVSEKVPYKLVPQDESKVTYAHKIEKAESKIDWNTSARAIHNKIRGMTLGPGTFTLHKGKKVKIHRTQITDEKKPGRAGTIVSAGENGIEVECAIGRLLILEIQPESAPKMTAQQYVLGHATHAGDLLG